MIPPTHVARQINPVVEKDFFIKKFTTGQNCYSVTVSLKCSLTKERMRMPARSVACDNHDAFEISNILSLFNIETSQEIDCPVCRKPMTLADIKFDTYLVDAIKEIKDNNVEYIQIYPATGIYYELDSEKCPINVTYAKFVKNVQYFYKLRRKFRTKWNLMNTNNDKFEAHPKKKNKVVKLTPTCPLNPERKIMIPIKSVHCTHIQCIDLKSFFEFQIKTGSYQCPLCPQTITDEYIMIDKIFYDICDFLNHTPSRNTEILYDPEMDTFMVGDNERRMDTLFNDSVTETNDDYDRDDFSEEYEWEDYGDGKDLLDFDVLDKLLKEVGVDEPKNYVGDYEPYALFPNYEEASQRVIHHDKYKGKFNENDDFDDDDYLAGYHIDPRELVENPTVDRHNFRDKAVKIYDDSQFNIRKDDVQLIPPVKLESYAGMETLDTKTEPLKNDDNIDPKAFEPCGESSESVTLDLSAIVQFLQARHS